MQADGTPLVTGAPLVQDLPSWLAQMLAAAIANPANANIRDLLHQLEQALVGLRMDGQLLVAGNFFTCLTEVYTARAEWLLAQWEERHNPILDEPILTREMLQAVLRQTMSLNLEGLLEETEFQRQRQHDLEGEPIESTAEVVEKEELLEYLAAIAQADAKQALAVAHDEDVSAWTRKIDEWMNAQSQSAISLVDLQRSLKLPLVNLWLAVLLGGYGIEQRGEFYQTEGVWMAFPAKVCLADSEMPTYQSS